MKAVTLFFITFLIVRGLSAQPRVYALSGSVTDSATGKPIAAVSVFLSGTSKGTTTHDDGTFLLTAIPVGGYQLIISAVGYATFQTAVSTSHLPVNLKVTLHGRVPELEVVTVEPDRRSGWKKWGELFLDYFIGTTGNASSCTLENKDAVRFHYHKKTNQLTVSASEPLVIVNKALGYTIEYRLEAFTYDLSTDFFSYYGYPLFREMTPKFSGQLEEWDSARQLVYLGSIKHFMRSLYQSRLRQEGFIISYEVKSPNVEKQRVKAIFNPVSAKTAAIPDDSLRHYRKVLREPDSFIKTVDTYDNLVTINPDQSRSFDFSGDFTVSWGNARLGIPYYQSTLELSYPVPLQIEENGSYLPPMNLLTKGTWAKTQTVCNLVPFDYIPPPATK
jgi:hypothetical protein